MQIRTTKAPCDSFSRAIAKKKSRRPPGSPQLSRASFLLLMKAQKPPFDFLPVARSSLTRAPLDSTFDNSSKSILSLTCCAEQIGSFPSENCIELYVCQAIPVRLWIMYTRNSWPLNLQIWRNYMFIEMQIKHKLLTDLVVQGMYP